MSPLTSQHPGNDERRIPLLQRCAEEGNEDDSREESDQGSEESNLDLQRREDMDAIEEEWLASNDALNLRLLHLDQQSVALLLQKWGDLCVQRRRQQQQTGSMTTSTRTVRKIVLDRCCFTDGHAVGLLVILLNQIGDELKELFLIDGCMEIAAPPGQSPLGAFLGGLGNLKCLECLVMERVDLRGQQTGFFLRCILANNPKLLVLQLPGCGIDDAMFDQFLVGLEDHSFELRHLDVGGWNDMNDQRLSRLVDALVYGGSHKNLQMLDISGSSIGIYSLKSLANLLYHCYRVEELVLCSCSCTDLLDDVQESYCCSTEDPANHSGVNNINHDDDHLTPARQAYGEFVEAVDSALSSRKQTNENLRLSYCNQTSPLFQALMGSNSNLQIIHQESAKTPFEPQQSLFAPPHHTGQHRMKQERDQDHHHHQQPATTSSLLHTSTRTDAEISPMYSYLDSCLSMMVCV